MSLNSRADMKTYDKRFLFVLDVIFLNLLDGERTVYSSCEYVI